MAELTRLEYKLNDEAIVKITDFMETWLTDHKIQSKNRTVFMLESMLLDIEAHSTQEVDVTLRIVRKLGKRSIKITYGGDAYNPSQHEEGGPLTRFFLEEMGFTPTWSYENKTNELVLEIPANRLKEETILLISFLAAMLIGSCGSLLPESVTAFLSEYVLGTISTIFMSLLGTFAGILIFFSILSGICGMESVAELSKKGKYMISRTVGMSIAGMVISGIISIPFFRFSYGESDGFKGIKDLYALVMDIIPTDPVTPFLEGKMLQICLISFITGGMIVMLGSRVKRLREIVPEGKNLIISIVELFCRFLPLYIFSDLVRLLWENGPGMVLSTWKPIITFIVICALSVILKLIWISVKFKVKLTVLFKKIFPSFLIGLTTASSMAAYGTSIEINEKKLGIESGYSNFATSIKNQIHGLHVATAYVIIIYYLAEYCGTGVDVFWFVKAWIFAFMLHLATPAISGGTLVSLGLMMSQFGFPTSCSGVAATLLLLFDFIETAAKTVFVHTEQIEEADHLGILDRNILVKE